MRRPYLELFFLILIVAVALAGKPVLAALLGIPAAVMVAKFGSKPFQEDR